MRRNGGGDGTLGASGPAEAVPACATIANGSVGIGAGWGDGGGGNHGAGGGGDHGAGGGKRGGP